MGEEWQTNNDFTHLILGMLFNELGRARYKPKRIIIHGNCQFLKSEKLRILWSEYLKAFNHIHINLYFETYRTVPTEEFINFYNSYPMIHNTIMLQPDTCIETFKTWAKINNFNSLTFIENRQYEYTQHDIKLMTEFYCYAFDYYKSLFSNKHQFAKWLVEQQSIIQLNPAICHGQDYYHCGCWKTLPIDLTDLSVGICHNLNKPHFTIGHYKIDENGHIVDFQVNNVDLLITRDHLKKSEMPKCIDCLYAGLCDGTCLACNYNVCGNPIIPMYEVCMLFRVKYSTLFYLIKNAGIDVEWQSENCDEYKYLLALMQGVLKQ